VIYLFNFKDFGSTSQRERGEEEGHRRGRRERSGLPAEWGAPHHTGPDPGTLRS